ncbi:MAG: HD domain-containing protein [Alphaproteobacteria bacterium]|nr:HD domain-containing protein [Alphaproteobacteria bacterium]
MYRLNILANSVFGYTIQEIGYKMDDKAIQIIQFMDIVEKLCYVKRFATLKNRNRERDSDHIMKLSFLVLMVSDFLENYIDKTKLFELALVHDLAEADTGDVSYMEQYNNSKIIEQKKAKELEVISAYCNRLPLSLSNKIFNLFMEYEKGTSIESKIIQSLDKLEGDLQCCKDKNVKMYCNHGAFLSRISALKEHIYSNKTGEQIIYALENTILKHSEKILGSSQKTPKDK